MNRSDIPGPQIEVRKIKPFSSLLNSLIILFSFLVIFSLIQSNFLKENWPLLSFWKLKIIDTSNAITILVSLLGLQIAQKSFVEGLKPFICYTIKKTADSKLNLPTNAAGFLSVSLQNQGKGAAIIKDMLFRIAFKDKKVRKLEDWTNNINAVRQILGDNKLQELEDYNVTFLSDGASIGSDKAEIVILEMPYSEINKFEYLDIKIIFDGFLGHRYSKTIYCLPRKR